MGSFEELFLIPVPFEALFTISLSTVIVRPLPWYENWLQVYLNKKTLTLAQLIHVFYANNMYMILLRGSLSSLKETMKPMNSESYRLHLMHSFGNGWGEQADRLSPLPNSADLEEVCRYHWVIWCHKCFDLLDRHSCSCTDSQLWNEAESCQCRTKNNRPSYLKKKKTHGMQ